MNPDERKALMDEHKRMADLVVQLGFASAVLFDDTTGMGTIRWTREGTIFRDQLLKAYDQIAKGKGKDGMNRLMGLLAFLFTQR